uniref:Uncharacterized protein n=1 Tax=Amphimedon queenslandica TaxID=400682 RepID=A0A1X7VTK0_AMPQE
MQYSRSLFVKLMLIRQSLYISVSTGCFDSFIPFSTLQFISVLTSSPSFCPAALRLSGGGGGGILGGETDLIPLVLLLFLLIFF